MHIGERQYFLDHLRPTDLVWKLVFHIFLDTPQHKGFQDHVKSRQLICLEKNIMCLILHFIETSIHGRTPDIQGTQVLHLLAFPS